MTSTTASPQSGEETTCPGCGLVATGEPTTPTERASPACQARYGALLALSYSNPAYRIVHQLIVDAYAAQHPTGTEHRQVQALALSLMTLCLFIEHDTDPREGPQLHQRMVANRPDFHWLDPPPALHRMTVADVLAARDAADHQRLAREWAQEMWQAWTPHHPTIRAWNADALGQRTRRR